MPLCRYSRIVFRDAPPIMKSYSGKQRFDRSDDLPCSFQVQSGFDVKADAEFIFDGSNQGNMCQGIPVINIIRSGPVRKNNALIVKNVPENII